MIRGVYVVQLKTKNLGALRKFYSKVLGLAVDHECKGCAILSLASGARVTIQQNDQAAVDLGETSPVSVGLEVDDVDALYRKATSEGAKSAAAPQDEPWGATTATLLDPDGNKINLIKLKPGADPAQGCCARRDETPTPAPMATKPFEPPKTPPKSPKPKSKGSGK